MSDLPAAAAPAEAPVRSPRSRLVYVTLALLGGSSGWHNFYVGRWWQGGLQLLLTVPSLWVIGAWMKQITPLAYALSGEDAPTALDSLAALVQTGIPGSPLLLGLAASAVWATVDIFAVKTDGAGRLLR